MSACRICFRKVGSISHKGKEVILIGNGLCKQCYDKDYKSRLSNTCKTCGGELIKPSARPVCRLCKKVKMEEYRLRTNKANKNKKKADMQTEGVPMTIAQREEIRRLLVRYKVGMQTGADHYRLISVYLEIYNADEELSSFTEDSQIIIVLKTLKKLFDAPFIEFKPKATDDMKEYHKKWRERNSSYVAIKRREKYLQNKDKYKEYMIEWKKNNPDKVEAYNAKKRKSRGQE
jgi:hypothetical protein